MDEPVIFHQEGDPTPNDTVNELNKREVKANKTIC